MLPLTKLVYAFQGVGILTLVIDRAQSAATAIAVIGLLCLLLSLVLREKQYG